MMRYLFFIIICNDWHKGTFFQMLLGVVVSGRKLLPLFLFIQRGISNLKNLITYYYVKGKLSCNNIFCSRSRYPVPTTEHNRYLRKCIINYHSSALMRPRIFVKVVVLYIICLLDASIKKKGAALV